MPVSRGPYWTSDNVAFYFRNRWLFSSEYAADHLLRDLKPKKEFNPSAINVMSIHKSKGLQADIVFITGMVDGVLPNHTKGLDTVEAQRRVLFVGITRTISRLYMLSCVQWDGKYVHKVDKSQFRFQYKTKKWNARTSKFVDEMR